MSKLSTERAIEALYTVRAYYASLTAGYPKGKDCKAIDDVTCSEIANSCLMAIKALEKEPRWIPVSERLPKPNRLVLCYITTGATETYFLALWNDTLNAWEEGIGGYRLLENDLGYKVVAWMPLPEPYKTESEVNNEN